MSVLVIPPRPIQPPQIYKQGMAPDQTYAWTNVPWPDDLWVDTTNHLLKRCVSMNPYVWVSVEGSGAGASVNDPFVTWSAAGDLTNQKVIGTFLTSVLQSALPFARGGTILSPGSSQTVIVWRAPFSCTVTAVKGYTPDATGSVVTALHNGLDLLVADLTLSSSGAWLDGGAVQNTAFVAGDTLSIEIVSVGGSPSQIAIQTEFTRP